MRTESGALRERTWEGVECSDTSEVVDRLRWQLRGWMDAGAPGAGAPDSGLARVGLVARDLTVAPPGATLWGRGDARARATRAALRVQSLLGDDRVLSPRLQGGHDPRSRIHEGVWGSPAPGLADVEGEWEGAVEDAPSTLLDVPFPVELWGEPAGARSAGSSRPLGLVASRGRLLPPPPPDEGAHALVPVHVGPRGTLDAEPSLLVPLTAVSDGGTTGGRPDPGPLDGAPASALLPPDGLEVGARVRVWTTGGPWPVRGRWWEGEGPRSPRAYLRVGREGGPDLLLVQRSGRWSIEGIHD